MLMVHIQIFVNRGRSSSHEPGSITTYERQKGYSGKSFHHERHAQGYRRAVTYSSRTCLSFALEEFAEVMTENCRDLVDNEQNVAGSNGSSQGMVTATNRVSLVYVRFI